MPEEMEKMLDLQLPEHPLPLKQLLEDCKITLKNQVKTGELALTFLPYHISCQFYFLTEELTPAYPRLTDYDFVNNFVIILLHNNIQLNTS